MWNINYNQINIIIKKNLLISDIYNQVYSHNSLLIFFSF